MKLPVSVEESSRLDALRHYKILDTPPEAAFDDLARLATQISQTPFSLIGFVDADREWCKSQIGISLPDLTRATSFSAHAIHSNEPLIVSDTRKDVRFASHPLVVGAPGFRFYAGVPLVTARGHRLGALSVLDLVPRQLAKEQLSAMQTLSKQILLLLELRREILSFELAIKIYQRREAELKEQVQKMAKEIAERALAYADTVIMEEENPPSDL